MSCFMFPAMGTQGMIIKSGDYILSDSEDVRDRTGAVQKLELPALPAWIVPEIQSYLIGRKNLKLSTSFSS